MKLVGLLVESVIVCVIALMLVACDESEQQEALHYDTSAKAYSIVLNHEEDVQAQFLKQKRRPFETIINVRMASIARTLRFTMDTWDTTVNVKDGMRSSNGIIVGVPRPIAGRCRILGDDKVILSVLVSKSKPVFYRVFIDSSLDVYVTVDDYFGPLD